MSEREVNVKLNADVSDYIAAMNRARRATRGLRMPYWVQVATTALMGGGIGAAATLLLTR